MENVADENKNISALTCRSKNIKISSYVTNLEEITNKSVLDFALYTPISSIQRFLARYELMKMIQDIPGAVIELGVCSGNGFMSLIHCHNVIQKGLLLLLMN
jgi:hypothetical protein